MTDKITILDPDCETFNGHTEEQIEYILLDNDQTMDDFYAFMRGQSVGLCQEHGPVYYDCDVKRFLNEGFQQEESLWFPWL